MSANILNIEDISKIKSTPSHFSGSRWNLENDQFLLQKALKSTNFLLYDKKSAFYTVYEHSVIA